MVTCRLSLSTQGSCGGVSIAGAVELERGEEGEEGLIKLYYNLEDSFLISSQFGDLIEKEGGDTGAVILSVK